MDIKHNLLKNTKNSTEKLETKRRQTLENAKNVPNCWLAKTMLSSATQLII